MTSFRENDTVAIARHLFNCDFGCVRVIRPHGADKTLLLSNEDLTQVRHPGADCRQNRARRQKAMGDAAAERRGSSGTLKMCVQIRAVGTPVLWGFPSDTQARLPGRSLRQPFVTLCTAVDRVGCCTRRSDHPGPPGLQAKLTCPRSGLPSDGRQSPACRPEARSSPYPDDLRLVLKGRDGECLVMHMGGSGRSQLASRRNHRSEPLRMAVTCHPQPALRSIHVGTACSSRLKQRGKLGSVDARTDQPGRLTIATSSAVVVLEMIGISLVHPANGPGVAHADRMGVRDQDRPPGRSTSIVP